MPRLLLIPDIELTQTRRAVATLILFHHAQRANGISGAIWVYEKERRSFDPPANDKHTK